MKYYSDYNKPYIYTVFDSSIEERVNEILKRLYDRVGITIKGIEIYLFL